MGIFVDKNNDFEVKVFYVIDEKDELHVLSNDDVKNLSKTLEEKTAIEYEKDENYNTIPFNVPVSIEDYDEKDIREAVVTFRRPGFDDVPVLLSSFTSMDLSSLSPGDVFEFNNRRLRLLFKKGRAQDKDGNFHKLTQENISNLSPALGSAIAMGMNDHMNMSQEEE